MPQKTPRPVGWGPDRARLHDVCLAAESKPSLSQNPSYAQAVRRLRRQRAVEVRRLLREVVSTGSPRQRRQAARLFDEIEDGRGRLTPPTIALAAVSGNRFPAAPLRAIAGAQR